MKAESASASSFQAVLSSPLPDTPYLGLRIENGCLTAIEYLRLEALPRCEASHRNICDALERYFSGEPELFDLPLCPEGTPFQQRVWQRLQRIPPGRVLTYGELARELNSSPRAVAGACRRNPIPVVVPCHRVVAASGPGGYMGQSEGRPLAIKQWLLQHEGNA